MTRAERNRARALEEQARRSGQPIFVNPYTGQATALTGNQADVQRAQELSAKNQAAELAKFEQKRQSAIASGGQRNVSQERLQQLYSQGPPSTAGQLTERGRQLAQQVQQQREQTGRQRVQIATQTSTLASSVRDERVDVLLQQADQQRASGNDAQAQRLESQARGILVRSGTQRPLQGLVPKQQRSTALPTRIIKPATPLPTTRRTTEFPSERKAREQKQREQAISQELRSRDITSPSFVLYSSEKFAKKQAGVKGLPQQSRLEGSVQTTKSAQKREARQEFKQSQRERAQLGIQPSILAGSVVTPQYAKDRKFNKDTEQFLSQDDRPNNLARYRSSPFSRISILQTASKGLRAVAPTTKKLEPVANYLREAQAFEKLYALPKGAALLAVEPVRSTFEVFRAGYRGETIKQFSEREAKRKQELFQSPEVQSAALTGGVIGLSVLFPPAAPYLIGGTATLFGAQALAGVVEEPSSPGAQFDVFLAGVGAAEGAPRLIRGVKTTAIKVGLKEVPIEELRPKGTPLSKVREFPIGKSIPEIMSRFREVSPRVTVEPFQRTTILGNELEQIRIKPVPKRLEQTNIAGFARLKKREVFINPTFGEETNLATLRHELTHLYDPKIPKTQVGRTLRTIFPERSTQRLIDLRKVSGTKPLESIFENYPRREYATEARARISENIPELVGQTTKTGKEVGNIFRPFTFKRQGGKSFAVTANQPVTQFLSIKKTGVQSFKRGGRIKAYHVSPGIIGAKEFVTLPGTSPEKVFFFSPEPSFYFGKTAQPSSYRLSLIPDTTTTIPRVLETRAKGIKRIPSAILAKERPGFPLSESYLQQQKGKGYLYVTVRSEKAYSSAFGGRKVGNIGTLTTEAEVGAPYGERIRPLKQRGGNIIQRLVGTKKFVRYKGQPFPIFETELVVQKGKKAARAGEVYESVIERLDRQANEYLKAEQTRTPYKFLSAGRGSKSEQGLSSSLKELSKPFGSLSKIAPSLSRYKPSPSLYRIKTPSYSPPKTPSKPPSYPPSRLPKYPPSRPPKYPPFEPPPKTPPLSPPKYPPLTPPKYPPIAPPTKYPPITPPKYPPFSPPRSPPPEVPRKFRRKLGERAKLFESGSRRPTKYAPSLTGIARELRVKKVPGGAFAGTELRRVPLFKKRLGLAERLNIKLPKVKL